MIITMIRPAQPTIFPTSLRTRVRADPARDLDDTVEVLVGWELHVLQGWRGAQHGAELVVADVWRPIQVGSG